MLVFVCCWLYKYDKFSIQLAAGSIQLALQSAAARVAAPAGRRANWPSYCGWHPCQPTHSQMAVGHLSQVP